MTAGGGDQVCSFIEEPEVMARVGKWKKFCSLKQVLQDKEVKVSSLLQAAASLTLQIAVAHGADAR